MFSSSYLNYRVFLSKTQRNKLIHDFVGLLHLLYDIEVMWRKTMKRAFSLF